MTPQIDIGVELPTNHARARWYPLRDFAGYITPLSIVDDWVVLLYTTNTRLSPALEALPARCHSADPWVHIPLSVSRQAAEDRLQDALSRKNMPQAAADFMLGTYIMMNVCQQG